MVPLVPGLRDDRLERRELLVGHGQRAKDVLLEQRSAREGEEERGRERLSAVAGREGRIRLTRHGLPAQVVLQRAERGAVRGGQTVLHLFEALHAQVVAHVEPELPELLLLHQRAVLALSFPRRRPHALAPRELGRGELGRCGHEGFCCCGRREGLWGGCGGEGLLRVRDGGEDLWWWLGVLLLLLCLLLLLLLLDDGHTYQTVL